ncbi:MAG: hypothetical protein WCX28_01435 [Bacteriovoracaceae bacterium]|nr:hypothetical protein [Bacteroidota bacterium]
MTFLQNITLLSIAGFGLLIPNGMFFYYVFAEFSSFTAVVTNWLAMGFIIDAFMAMGLLAWWVAKNPIGTYTWKTFILLSLLGGLGFSLPFFYYLNKKQLSMV